jgi:predicted nucleotidyltransferase
MRLDQPLNDIFASGTHVKLLRALCTLPAGVTVSARDVARRAGVSHPRASTVLTRLADEGVATVQRLPRTDLYGLNREHVLVEVLIQVFLRESQFKFELLSFVARELKRRRLPITQARVFGSAARGDTTSTSDVDLALVAPRESVSAVETAAQELAETVRKRFGMRLNVLVGSPTLGALTRTGRPGRKVWQAVEREGIDVWQKQPQRADG